MQVQNIIKFTERARIVALEVCARQVLNAAVDVTPKSLRGGNLRGSAFTEREKDSVMIGYTASYAVYVHENTQRNVRFTTSGTKAKFLSSTAEEMHKTINDVFHKTMLGLLKQKFKKFK